MIVDIPCPKTKKRAIPLRSQDTGTPCSDYCEEKSFQHQNSVAARAISSNVMMMRLVVSRPVLDAEAGDESKVVLVAGVLFIVEGVARAAVAVVGRFSVPHLGCVPLTSFAELLVVELYPLPVLPVLLPVLPVFPVVAVGVGVGGIIPVVLLASIVGV